MIQDFPLRNIIDSVHFTPYRTSSQGREGGMVDVDPTDEGNEKLLG